MKQGFIGYQNAGRPPRGGVDRYGHGLLVLLGGVPVSTRWRIAPSAGFRILPAQRIHVRSGAEQSQVLMGIEIRLFPVIDAFSRFSGTPLACFSGPSLGLAKQLLDSTAAASSSGPGLIGAGVAVACWRRFKNPRLAPRIRRILAAANSRNNAILAARVECWRTGVSPGACMRTRGPFFSSRPISAVSAARSASS